MASKKKNGKRSNGNKSSNKRSTTTTTTTTTTQSDSATSLSAREDRMTMNAMPALLKTMNKTSVAVLMFLLTILLVALAALISLGKFGSDSIGRQTSKDSKDSSDNHLVGGDRVRLPDECSLAMAPSGVPNGGWGVFSLTPRSKGDRVLEQGDIVIQLPDPNPHHAHAMKRLIWEYAWDGQETGGQYEGLRTISIVPGMGMLVNGHPSRHNVAPFYFPQVDDAGISRFHMPGAGASSHYHNFTWYAEEDIQAGDELFLDYGPGWFRERNIAEATPAPNNSPPVPSSLDLLKQQGYCLDNIVPRPSLLEGAGRGAFASRDLQFGDIVAPVPVIALSLASLETIKQKTDGTILTTHQLLRNYCFGHKHSTMLLYPYSHGVNLINHHHDSPNVQLKWWDGSKHLFDKSLAELQQSSSQLMMELVATRPLKKGEEIYLNYGRDWSEAWNNHLKSWQQRYRNMDHKIHISAEYMNNNDDYHVIRTEQEQQSDPYPPDVITSCFFRFADHSKLMSNSSPSTNTTIGEWKHYKKMLELRNLRPCMIVHREEEFTVTTNKKRPQSILYTVRIMNRPGLNESERIPKGRVHYVTHVPRYAILFSDKVYTSNQHLENAFRMEIGLGDIFPEQWKDKKTI